MKKEEMMVAYYFIYSVHRVTKAKRLDLIIEEMVDKHGKTKYHSYIPSFNYFEDPKKMRKLEKNAQTLKEKNPDFEVHYCTKREFKKDKRLKKVVNRKIISLIKETLIIPIGLVWASNISMFTIPIQSLILILGASDILSSYKTINNYMKKVYPRNRKKAYCLELLYSLFLFQFPISAYQERLQTGVDATVETEYEMENEDSIFNQVDSKSEKIEILYDTLKNNENINESQYSYFQCFKDYYEANEFLNYERVNQNYEFLEIKENVSLPEPIDGRTLTRDPIEVIGIPPTARIELKEGILDDPASSYHEGVHLTGGLPYKFLGEGMVEFLTNEFFTNYTYSSESYYEAGYFIRILIEIVGPDAMLQAFSEESMGPINVELEKIIEEREPRKKLYQSFEKMDLYFLLDRDEQRTAAYQDVFEALSPYAEEKLGISLNKDSFTEPLHPCQEYVTIILEDGKPLNPQKTKKYINQ